MAFFDIPGVERVHQRRLRAAPPPSSPARSCTTATASTPSRSASIKGATRSWSWTRTSMWSRTRRAALIAALCGPAAPGNSAARRQGMSRAVPAVAPPQRMTAHDILTSAERVRDRPETWSGSTTAASRSVTPGTPWRSGSPRARPRSPGPSASARTSPSATSGPMARPRCCRGAWRCSGSPPASSGWTATSRRPSPCRKSGCGIPSASPTTRPCSASRTAAQRGPHLRAVQRRLRRGDRKNPPEASAARICAWRASVATSCRCRSACPCLWRWRWRCWEAAGCSSASAPA